MPERQSIRPLIRDTAAAVLREERTPVHIFVLAERVRARIGPDAPDRHTINNCLHDAPARRFVRLARGAWALPLAAP